MAIAKSTGLKDGTNSTGSFVSVLNNMLINVYTGSAPSPNAAMTGTLLATISLGGVTNTPLVFGSSSGGTLAMPSGADWHGVNVASGTPGYFVAYNVGDTLGASTSAPRFTGTCGTSGTDMVLSAAAVVSGQNFPVTSFTYTPG